MQEYKHSLLTHIRELANTSNWYFYPSKRICHENQNKNYFFSQATSTNWYLSDRNQHPWFILVLSFPFPIQLFFSDIQHLQDKLILFRLINFQLQKVFL